MTTNHGSALNNDNQSRLSICTTITNHKLVVSCEISTNHSSKVQQPMTTGHCFNQPITMHLNTHHTASKSLQTVYNYDQ